MLLYNFHFNFILFVHAGHANFGFIDVQYLQNEDVVFSIEIGLNCPNYSSTDFHYSMKKSLPSPKCPTSPITPLRQEISPLSI